MQLQRAQPDFTNAELDETANIDENHMLQFDRMNPDPEAEWTFGRKLRNAIANWAESECPEKEDAQLYLHQINDVRYAGYPKVEKAVLREINYLENKLGRADLSKEVKIVFCTLSTSAHESLVSAFKPSVAIIDDAAHESLAGLVTLLGAYKDDVKHVVLAGDHKQGRGVYAAKESNLGHNMLSLNLFEKAVDNNRGKYECFQLTQSHRMLPALLEFTKRFYKQQLKAADGSREIEAELQVTLKAYWKARLRENLRGSFSQIALDCSGDDVGHAQHQGDQSRFNTSEAKAIAWTVKDMLAVQSPGWRSQDPI